MAETTTTPAAEPASASASAATAASEPKFKIGASGTHQSMVTDAPKDTPPPPPGPAEPAKPKTEGDASQNTNEPPAAATTGEPPKVHSAKIGSPKPQGTPSEPAPAAQPAATTVPPSWEDTLKAQGFDEQFIKLAQVYKQEGNITRYAQAMSTDYTKMPAEDIHRIAIQREYPAATPDQLEILYQAEVNDKYKLDSEKFDPESNEAKAGKLKMTMDAEKLRSKFSQENEGLKLPTRDVAGEVQQQQQAAATQRQAATDELLANPFSQSVLTDKKMVLKGLSLKDENGKVVSEIPDFAMELEDVDSIKDFLISPDGAKKHLLGADGKPDPEAFWEMALFATNRTGYKQTLINYGKMLGKEEYVEEKYNAPRPGGTAASPAKESLNQAFANRGTAGKHGG